MIGNWKNSDLVKKVLIELIKKEDSKTYSDLLKIHMDISIGELLEISQLCQKLWLQVSLLFGFLLFSK
jgi:hypothetical protein